MDFCLGLIGYTLPLKSCFPSASNTELPILPGVADAPTSATDFGVKKDSIDVMFGFALEIEFFLNSLFRIIFASTTKCDFGYTITGLKSILLM